MKASSSNIIPGDSASGARRWEPLQIEAVVSSDALPSAQATRPGEPMGIGAESAAVLLPADEARRIREHAAREGFEQGLADGRAQGARDAAELRLLLAGIREIAQGMEQNLAERLVELSIELARAVVRKSIEVKPEIIVDMIREAVASLPDAELQAEVTLHPDDARLLRAALRSDPNATSAWNIVEDSKISRGGCLVSKRSSDIDATLESRWHRIVASLGRDDRWLPSRRNLDEAGKV